MGLLLGIDLGTSYFKVGLFDPTGSLKGLGRVAVEADTRMFGRVELTVTLFWVRLRKALDDALAQAGVKADQITGISYSSQANTFILLDGHGKELTPLIFWNDQRARPIDDPFTEFSRLPEYGSTTGMMDVLAESMPVKCSWFARHEPMIWARTRWIMTISDYLAFALTGMRVGDASTAALTGLYSLPARSWWPKALETFGIEAEQLSSPLPPGTVFSHTCSRALSLLGLPASIPFAVGALDHHAAALGSGLGEIADICLSTGTVVAALALVDEITPASGCIHGPHTDGRHYYRLAFDANGAGQLEEYQRRCAPDLAIEELLRLAEQSAAKPSQKSGRVDVPSRHGIAMLILLEKIAHVQKVLIARVAGSTPVLQVTATGGGARSPFWLQITADAIGLPVGAVAAPERGCLGAAILAAVAAGVWPDVGEATRRMIMPPCNYVPRGGRSK